MDPAVLGDVLARVNAGLNCASLLLLVLGWLSIRAKRIERHRLLMRSAFITSTLFLVSYVTRYALTGTHHIAATGLVKGVYLAILFSHMVLAAATVPLSLRALYLAYRQRFAEHRRVARITFPIWAYVSFTGVIVYAMLYHVVGTAEAHVTPAALRLPLPAFTLTDHHNKPFGLQEMKGRVWIADFVFTHCPTVCPRLTKRMVAVQEKTSAHGDALHLVTFSVDPENDTPEVLAAYAKTYGADPVRWTFLTGPLDTIEGTVVKGFKMYREKKETVPGSGIMTIFHGEKFVLVDREGNIRGYYDADDEGLSKLVSEAGALVKEKAR